MKLPHLGHAVIINNLGNEFKGTKVDVDALVEALNIVGFDVHVYNDCTKQVCNETLFLLLVVV